MKITREQLSRASEAIDPAARFGKWLGGPIIAANWQATEAQEKVMAALRAIFGEVEVAP